MDFELAGIVGEALRRWPLPEGESRVGRNPDSPISIPDRSVSREHALLARRGDEVTVTDLGSRNGTAVNGQRLRAAQTLRVGDQIAFGNVLLRLERESVPVHPSLSEHTRLDSTVKLAWQDVRSRPAGEARTAVGSGRHRGCSSMTLRAATWRGCATSWAPSATTGTASAAGSR